MKPNVPVYEAVFEEGKSEGVYALSVVENPAMQDMWITLSEHPQQIELAQVNEEKRLLLGAALIPDKPIYRNVDGNEFYITFKAETIERLWHNFFKSQNNNNSSLEHEIKLEGMSVVEGWTVEDPEKDKSAVHGKTYPKGTAVALMKVDNDEIWQKVKQGDIKGFSIDALLGLQQINLSETLKTEIEMTEETQNNIVSKVVDGVKAWFTSQKEIEETEVVSEEVVEVQNEETETVETPEVDIDALVAQISEKVQAQFQTQLSEHEQANKAALDAKDKEIEELRTQLSNQPEKETVTVSPEVEKREVKFNSNKIQTSKGRAMSNIAQAMGW